MEKTNSIKKLNIENLGRISDLGKIRGEVIFVRADFNVPVNADLKVTHAARIEAIRDTLNELTFKGAKIVLISHFGRPNGSEPSKSLEHIVDDLSREFNRPVKFVNECYGEEVNKAINALNEREILLLENLRFYDGETENSEEFIEKVTEKAYGYVIDTFSTSHRAHASIAAIKSVAKKNGFKVVAGNALLKELGKIKQHLSDPKRPLQIILGGSKADSKIDILQGLLSYANGIYLGGGVSHTFLAAKNVPGFNKKNSCVQPEFIGAAQKILEDSLRKECKIILPTDFVVAEKYEKESPCRTHSLSYVPANGYIMDIGQQSVGQLRAEALEYETIIWNGSLGVFELPPFDTATNEIAKHIDGLVISRGVNALSAGGDNQLAMANVGAKNICILSGGGALLELLAGKPMPGLDSILRVERKKVK